MYRRLKKFLLLGLALVWALQPLAAMDENNDPDYNEEAIKQRILALKSQIASPQYTPVVKSYIKTYTILKRPKAESILGRQVVYFPLFESYLKKYNLPDDLKYLAVVESALDPQAVSSAGAVGLWQFMEATGRYFGLEINSTIDERRDPHRSTDAAMVYLGRLYDRFGDWELAIAAYNSGGGRVSRAVKRARSKNYWTVKRYLPRETANYVPAFIAATYLIKHYEEHNLQPNYPSLDEQITETTKVYQTLSFYQLAQITGVSLETIEQLNPAYQHKYIPMSSRGRNLTLPKRSMPLLKAYLNSRRPDYAKQQAITSAPVFISQPKARVNRSYQEAYYIVQPGQTIYSLARKLNCTVHQIKAWNNLKSDEIRVGQKLKVYEPRPVDAAALDLMFRPSPQLPKLPVPNEVASSLPKWEESIERLTYKEDYLYFRLPKNERVDDIAERFPGITTAELLRLNEWDKNIKVKAETMVKIKRLN